MASTSDRHTMRPAPREDAARMEARAIEAGRWLRRTGRVSLPVRSGRRGGRPNVGATHRLRVSPHGAQGE